MKKVLLGVVLLSLFACTQKKEKSVMLSRNVVWAFYYTQPPPSDSFKIATFRQEIWDTLAVKKIDTLPDGTLQLKKEFYRDTFYGLIVPDTVRLKNKAGKDSVTLKGTNGNDSVRFYLLRFDKSWVSPSGLKFPR